MRIRTGNHESPPNKSAHGFIHVVFQICIMLALWSKKHRRHRAGLNCSPDAPTDVGSRRVVSGSGKRRSGSSELSGLHGALADGSEMYEQINGVLGAEIRQDHSVYQGRALGRAPSTLLNTSPPAALGSRRTPTGPRGGQSQL